MKKCYILLLILINLTGCKIRIDLPECYYHATEAFKDKDYETVISLLENTKISHLKKTDWYYYLYGMSLYYQSKTNTRKAIDNMKIAISFYDDFPMYHFYIGQMYFDIADYQTALQFFKETYFLCKKQNNAEQKNIDLWIALTLCRLDEFNASDFEKIYSANSSAILMAFCKQLSDNKLSESYINDVINSDILSLDEKIQVIDILVSRIPGGKEICEKLMKEKIDENILKYVSAKLVFFNLTDLELCKTILQSSSTEISNDVFILNCDNFTISQFYNKYLCFYLYKKNELIKAVNALRAYQVSRYKPQKYSHAISDDVQLIMQEFENDEEFVKIF